MAPSHPSKLAVVVGLAVGVFVSLGAGELHADRDVDGELLRANASLERRLAAQESTLAELQTELDELRRDREAAQAKPRTNNPDTAPNDAPDSVVKKEVEEAVAFRKKALAALAPELEAIDARAAAIEAKAASAKATFDKHTHEVEFTSHGWVKLDVMLDADHLDVVRAPYRNDFVAIRDSSAGGSGTFMRATTKPK